MTHCLEVGMSGDNVREHVTYMSAGYQCEICGHGAINDGYYSYHVILICLS